MTGLETLDPANERVDPERAFELGVRLAGEDRLAEAEQAFARADDGAHASGAFNLGVLLAYRGEVNEAEAAFRRADDRGLADAAFELAMLMVGQRRLAEAEEAFARADQRGHARAALQLGMLLQDRGERAGAADAYLRADARGDADGAFETGVLLAENGRLAEAEKAFARAHARGHAKAAHNLAVLSEYRRSIDQEEATSLVGAPTGTTPNAHGHAETPGAAEPEAGEAGEEDRHGELPPARGLTSKRRRRRLAIVLVALAGGIVLVAALAAEGAKSPPSSAATSASSAPGVLTLGTAPTSTPASAKKTPDHAKTSPPHKTQARSPHAQPGPGKTLSAASARAHGGASDPTASTGSAASTTTAAVSGAATPASTATPPAPASKPVNNSPAVISGTTTVGQPLSSSTGGWSGAAPIAYRYQWMRCTSSCSPIAGAASSTYTPTSVDVGARLAVLVTAAADSSGTSSVQSARVGPVSSPAPTTDQVKAALAQAVAVSDPPSAVAQLLTSESYLTPFSAPSGGVLTINWYLAPNGAAPPTAPPVLIASTRVGFRHPREAFVEISLTGAGKQMLGATKVLSLTAVGSFTVAGGTTTSLTKAIRLQFY